MLLLLLACAGSDSVAPCPESPCRDEVTIHMVGPNGPTVAAGTVLPADSALITFDCRERSGADWTCAADGTLHVYTRAGTIAVDAYSTDANAQGSGTLTLDWASGGTDECPSGCDVAETTFTLSAFDSGCFASDGDTGGC